MPVLGISKRTVETRKTEVLRSEPFGALLDLIAPFASELSSSETDL